MNLSKEEQKMRELKEWSDLENNPFLLDPLLYEKVD
jgi:hypothetical protein